MDDYVDADLAMGDGSSDSFSSLPPDLIVRVSLFQHDLDLDRFIELQPSVWRRLRLSSATSLDLLADKILAPIMGWERNYHTYCFRHLSDLGEVVKPWSGGLVYLQQDTDAIDVMHVDEHVGQSGRLSEKGPEKVTIGELLVEVGNRCLYTYDLGDSWHHVITLEAISIGLFGPRASVELLDGAMRCPDEDGRGGSTYQEQVLDLYNRHRADPSNDNIARELARNCFERRNSLNVLGSFRPEEFNLEEHRSALKEALGSRNSARKSVKMFGGFGDMFGFSFGGGGKLFHRAQLGQQSLVCKVEIDGGMPGERTYDTYTETVNLGPDPKEGTLCYQWGSPFGRCQDEGGVSGQEDETPTASLRTCARCHIPYYCSRECQSEHWSVHRKECKKCLRAHQKYQKELKTGILDPNRIGIPVPDRKLNRYDANKLRFEPNDCVECMVGKDQWMIGYIVQTLFKQNERWPVSAYQIFLPGMVEKTEFPFIHALWDDDYQIRKIPDRLFSTTKDKKKFMGKARADWASAMIEMRSAASRGMEDEYNIWPSKSAEMKVHSMLKKTGTCEC